MSTGTSNELRYSLLMIICTSVYSIADGFFVSNFVRKTPFATINLVMPVLMAVGIIGFMIGTRGSAIVSKAMGEGKKEQASQYFSMLIYTSFIFGVVFSCFCWYDYIDLVYRNKASRKILCR